MIESNQFSYIFPENLDHQDTDARNNINTFSNESSSTGVEFSIETLREESEPVVAENTEIGYGQKSIKEL